MYYNNYCRIETVTASKPDSPLDLSVKTIQQSADSTALDDPENAAFGQHFPLSTHQSLRPEGRHPNLPQLPYAPVPTLPGVRNHSNGAQNRQTHYSTTNIMPASFQEPPYASKNNGQLHDELTRHPVSEFRNEKMTVSITYEQKQQTHRTQVNAQVSSLQYSSSHFYHHTAEGSVNSNSRPQQPLLVERGNRSMNQLLSVDTNNVSQNAPPKSPLAPPSRKRRPLVNEPPAPVKVPRKKDWRESIDKDIENRLNAYTSMKAKEEEEKKMSSTSRNSDSYRNESLPRKEKIANVVKEHQEQRDQYHQMSTLPQTLEKYNSVYSPQPAHSPKVPFTQFLEQQQHKAQHKLPVQPLQIHQTPQQWYQNIHPHQSPLPLPSASSYPSLPYKLPSIYSDTHTMQFCQSDFDSRDDFKIIQKIENPKLSADADEQKPLPPFRALPPMNFSPQSSNSKPTQPLPPITERLQEERKLVVDIKSGSNSSDVEFLSASRKEKDDQSRAALMASALSHPRIRTKAELKQVTPVDKSKSKSAEVSKLPDAAVQNLNKFSNRSQSDSETKKTADGKGYIFESKLDIVDDAVYNHRPVSVNSVNETENLTTSSSALSSSSYVDFNKYSPRKRLFSKTEENGMGVKRSSSETTVFEFRDSDSETETSSNDLHSLNEMRKDRKTRTPSATPTTIDQLSEGHHSDDSQWMEACEELINQFSFNDMKKRGGKKKMTAINDSSHDDEPSSPKKKFIQYVKSEESEDEKPEPVKVELVSDEIIVVSPEKIKKEIGIEDTVEKCASMTRKPTTPKRDRVKVGQKKLAQASPAEAKTVERKVKKELPRAEAKAIEPKVEVVFEASPTEAKAVERKAKDIADASTPEVKTVERNVKEVTEASLSEAKVVDHKTKEVVEASSRDAKTVERKVKDVVENDSQERKTAKDVEIEKSKAEKQTFELRGQRSNVSTTRIRIQNLLEDSSDTDDNVKEKNVLDRKAKNVKEIGRKALAKVLAQKKKKILKKKKKKNRKVVSSKKLKKVDVKREKMRHMIRRRMETRKSKLDAMKCLRKTKMEKVESSILSNDSQPIMTRKMARRECQKDSRRPVVVQKKIVVLKTTNKGKMAEKEEKKTTKEKTEKDKIEKRDKGEQEKVEKQEEKTKKSARDERSKKYERLRKSDRNSKSDSKDKIEDVTRRSLRSRNFVVTNNKLSKKLKKKALNNAKEKLKSPMKVKKEVKNEPKNDQKKEENKIVEEKPESDPSWEEELFKYKYSLRMPVKLINLARPTNWPKSNGGCSSLPDLDRKETDSDLLNDVVKQKTPKKKNNKHETKFSNTKEFKDSVKYLKEKFDKKIEEKNQQGDSLTKLMMEKKMKIIPKSSGGPELLPTPNVDSFKSKFSSKMDTSKRDERRSKDSCKNDDDDEDKDEVVEESLIGYFRKETVDVFKEVFEKHNNKVHNQFKTVILETRTRTQTKEMKHDATLKRVFGLDRPASAPPIQDSNDIAPSLPQPKQPLLQSPQEDKKVRNSLNGVHQPWENFTKLKFLMSEEAADSDKDSKDFEDAVDFVTQEEDAKDANEVETEIVVKKKSRQIRRKCRSSGFDYIRKKKKQKKEEDTEETVEEKEKKKPPVSVRPTAESVEDIQNEIRSWVVNKGIGETVLHKAARLGYLDISSYCLEKLQCLPSPTDNAGYTPLHEACTRGHLKIAKMLLKFGADVSASARGGIRPLHEAVENGNVELVRLLLSYGADPLLSTYAGQTPLSLVKEDQDDLKEFLLLYLADIQGNPSKPWPFGGIDDFDREVNGYDPLTEIPTSNYEELETLEIDMSDLMLPNLYRFKDEFDYWVLCSDLPNRIREIVVKAAQDQNPPPYIVRKITRTDFDENVECVMLLQNKYLQKTKTKCPLISLVKYTEKLVSILSIQKISMSLS